MSTPSEPDPAPARKLEDLIADKQGFLTTDDTVAKAGEKMRSTNSEVLPVSEGRRLVGIVDEKNPDRASAGHGHDPQVVKVGEAMNRNIIYCFEDQDAAEARRIMNEAKLNVLPIVDREMRIVGMLTRDELGEG
jgi:CBS domain-containing protein